MSATAKPTISQLRSPILRSVSRSFYLSIRFLPSRLRDPIALAYLLARATDTIADTAELEPAGRMRHLETLAGLIQGRGGPDSTRQLIAAFAPLQKDTGERTLIERLPTCLEWLDRVPVADRADIREVLAKINEGQRLDVMRFGDPASIGTLQTAAELDRYTYLVAGSVGEFWTGVCERHLPEFASRSAEQMNGLGIEYGKGLQLINILRDAGSDLRTGRCYIPPEELQSLGVTPGELQRQAVVALPVFERWRERAEKGISAGIEYSCAIRPWRVRLATVLPALIGARTLSLLKKAGADNVHRKVKVRRREVRSILLTIFATLASPRAIRAMFAELSK